MQGISSRHNDRFLGLQLKKNYPNLRQQAMVTELNEEQLASFVDNYRRMVLYQRFGNEQERFAAAMQFEAEVAAWLGDVPYYRESDLRQRNKDRQQEGLRALPTPDFLLRTPIDMFGTTVHWFECKNYYASTEPKMMNKLNFIKTAKKYRDVYGSGVMLFKYGFNKDLKIPRDVLFIDFLKL
tara:strand:- start:2796 stop:3341 length:546 start_codon:yes stop_codon:yes gene_type:complete